MFLNKIRLFEFRCFSEIEINFSNRINLIWGENAQGKTSVLEAIYLLTGAKSFRTYKNNNLIKSYLENNNISSNSNLAKQASIFGNFSLNAHKEEESKTNFEVLISSTNREYFIDQSKKKITDYYGKIFAIAFSPDDSEILKGSPQIRRSLIDKLIVDLYPSKLKLITSYSKALANKNKLLKENSRAKDIETWNEILIPLSYEIVNLRLSTMLELEKYSNLNMFKISSNKENLSLKLNSRLISDGKILDLVSIKNHFKNLLEIELKAKRSIAGCQSDDIVFFINKNEAKATASQGQTRTIILALKMAMIDMIKDIQGIDPIILLDDLDAEFDLNRLGILANMIQNRASQIFISTTNSSLGDLFAKENIGMFEIKNSQFKK